jgi:hypothetical protein
MSGEYQQSFLKHKATGYVPVALCFTLNDNCLQHATICPQNMNTLTEISRITRHPNLILLQLKWAKTVLTYSRLFATHQSRGESDEK